MKYCLTWPNFHGQNSLLITELHFGLYVWISDLKKCLLMTEKHKTLPRRSPVVKCIYGFKDRIIP